MINEPYFWYTLGYEFGIFDDKIHAMKMIFVHNFGVTSYFVKICAHIQQNLLKQLEEELTKLVMKEYKTEYLPGYDIIVKDIFKINKPLNNDTTELSIITSPRKLSKSYRTIFEDHLHFMRLFVVKLKSLFFDDNNEIINNLIEGIDKLKEIINNKRIYDDYSA